MGGQLWTRSKSVP